MLSSAFDIRPILCLTFFWYRSSLYWSSFADQAETPPISCDLRHGRNPTGKTLAALLGAVSSFFGPQTRSIIKGKKPAGRLLKLKLSTSSSMSASSSATPGTASPASLTFRVDHVQDSSTTTSKTASDRRKARQGVLSFKHGSSATSHDTPTPAIVSYSKKGAPVHLSRDNVDRLPIEMVMLAYEHL